MKVSLFCIVMNNPDGLRTMLESVKGRTKDIFDEIVIVDTESTDNGATVAVAREYTSRIYTFKRPDDFPWVEDFSEVRNFAMSKCTGDYIVWLDSDDVAVGFRKLRDVIDRVCEKDEQKADCLFLRYDYAFDEYGNPTTIQFRERVLRSGTYRWKAPLHEVAIPVRAHQSAKLGGDSPYVRHEGAIADRQRDMQRMDRNIKILERYEEKHGDLETRMKLYKGNTLMGLERYTEAAKFIEDYIEDSGFDEEVYIARCNLASCYMNSNDYDSAIRSLQDAIFEMPDQPAAWSQAAEIFMRNEDWSRAYKFAKTATECKEDTSHVAFNPLQKIAFPSAILQVSCLHLQKFAESEEWGKKAAMFMRGDDEVRKLLVQTQRILADKRIYDGAMEIKRAIEEEGSDDKLEKLKLCIPDRIKDLGVFGQDMVPVLPEDKPHIVIYCGNSIDTWGPRSVWDGIGGSEEAVINIAYEFRDLGWHVEVYGNPPMDNQGDFNGVYWLPYWVFDRARHCDVFVAWRAPAFVTIPLNADQKHLWLHDKQHEVYRPDILEKIDRIFVLSKYHRQDPGLVGVPEDKIYYTRNGLNDMFLEEAGDNDPKRLIFPSSPDRSLDLVLEMFKDVRKAVPDAELDVYYGFTKHYDENAKRSKYLKDLKAKILKLLEQPGVNYHGMVGHDELAKAYAKAGIWMYPTQWPETSCITAMKAVAMGCTPVTSGYGVLPETLMGYDKGPVDTDDLIYENKDRKYKFVQAVINNINNPVDKKERLEMARTFRSFYNWKMIAEEWDRLFLETWPQLVEKATLAKQAVLLQS